MSVIRSGSLRGFRALVRDLGGDADALADAAGLPPGALDTEEMLIPSGPVDTLLRAAAAALACPDMGLRLAARQDLTALGPLGLVLRSCTTMAEVLTCAKRYLPVQSPTMALALDPDPYGAPGVVAIRIVGAAHGDHDPGADVGLATIHRAIIELTGARYGLRSIELPYQPAAPLAVYEDFFGAPVRTMQPAALLRVPAALLNAAVTRPDDPHRRPIIEAFLTDRLPAHTAPALALRTRIIIQDLLSSATPDVTTVADALGMHPRTLQRRLRDEHTSFTAVLDQARQYTAHRYLTTTDLSIGKVAALAGLSEQSALTRCAKRWWNLTPGQVRRCAGMGQTAGISSQVESDRSSPGDRRDRHQTAAMPGGPAPGSDDTDPWPARK
jgi:AraC-like DNA-binding protein